VVNPTDYYLGWQRQSEWGFWAPYDYASFNFGLQVFNNRWDLTCALYHERAFLRYGTFP